MSRARAREMAARVISFDVGIRHLAFAEIDVLSTATETRLRIVRWETIDLGPRVAGADVPVAVVSAMRARFASGGDGAPTCVLIENQPAFKNAAMKTVQVALHTFFVMAGGYAVRLVSASCKHSAETMRQIAGPTADPPPPPASAAAPPEGAKSGAAYRARKAAAVRACEQLLVDVLADEERAAWLRSHKKRDDLSDCLLQAVDHARRCGGRHASFGGWNGLRCGAALAAPAPAFDGRATGGTSGEGGAPGAAAVELAPRLSI